MGSAGRPSASGSSRGNGVGGTSDRGDAENNSRSDHRMSGKTTHNHATRLGLHQELVHPPLEEGYHQSRLQVP